MLDAKITHFPLYLLQGLIYECIVDDDTMLRNNIELTLKSLFLAEQSFDIIAAYKYTENHFLAKEITSFTAASLENFIKATHAIMAHSLLLAKQLETFPGEYTRSRSYIRKETGEANLDFNDTPFYDEHNYEIIKKVHGDENAKQYKLFSDELKRCFTQEWEKVTSKEASASIEKQYVAEQIDAIDVIKKYKLDELPGHSVFLKIVDYSPSPTEIPLRMKSFCNELIKMIRARKNPLNIAAYALTLPIIHPFPNGNGRISRLLANSILMYYGIKPIHFDSIKHNYYSMIERQDIRSLKKFLETTIKKQQQLPLKPRIIDNVFNCFGKENEGSLYVQHQNYIALVKINDLDHYNQALLTHNRITTNIAANREGSDVLNQLDLVSKNLYQKYEQERIDGEWFYQKAKEYQTKHMDIAIYCYLRAADFSGKEKHFSNQSHYYLQAANLLLREHRAYAGYYATKLAEKLHISEHKNQVDELLNQLQFLDSPIVSSLNNNSFNHTSLKLATTNYTPTLFKAPPLTHRQWANKELLDKYYGLLDSIANKLIAQGYQISPIEEKLKTKASKQGWLLYSFKGHSTLLATITFSKSKDSTSFLNLIQEQTNLNVKSFNKSGTVGIYWDVNTQIENEFTKCIKFLKIETQQQSNEQTIVKNYVK